MKHSSRAPRGRTSAILALAVLLAALAIHNATAASISYVPAQPSSNQPVTIRITDGAPYSVFEGGPHAAATYGSVIRIEGCIPNGGFAVSSVFDVDVTVAPLAPGEYEVQYYRTFCAQFAPPLELRATSTLTVRAASPTEPLMPIPPSEVVHYWHRQFDHYFITADNWEKLRLETGRFSGWERVSPFLGTPPAWRFGMYLESGDERVAVCRFFSDRFVPKSSHFYAVGKAECDAVKLNRDWTYEGVVGYVYGRLADGSCNRGVPLYRLYNNGQGGAPNHRYTASWLARAEMVGRGWIPEGDGVGVIACVPNVSP